MSRHFNCLKYAVLSYLFLSFDNYVEINLIFSRYTPPPSTIFEALTIQYKLTHVLIKIKIVKYSLVLFVS